MTDQRSFLLGALMITLAPLVESLRAETSASAKRRTNVTVNARKVIANNDRFWANVVFHPTEYLSTDWGREHLTLLRRSGAALKYVRLYNQPEDAVYLSDDGSVGYRWEHFDQRADLILKEGLKPSVAFFSMPAPIAADPSLCRKRPFLDGKPIYLGAPVRLKVDLPCNALSLIELVAEGKE